MRIHPLLPILLLCASCASLYPADFVGSRGHLVIVGGGRTPEVAREVALDLAAGARTVVAVLPWADEGEGRGDSSVRMWREQGASEVHDLDHLDPGDALELLQRADLIWMSGDSQSGLMDELRSRGLVELLRARFEAGAVVGGTSAGAAVLSAVMITGSPERAEILAGNTPTAAGLGLWPGAIVDQEFVQRARYSRLIAAVLDRPQLVGVGIAEDTAVIVHPQGLAEVVGQGNVLVIDARAARVAEAASGETYAADGLKLDVLRAGNGFTLAPVTR